MRKTFAIVGVAVTTATFVAVTASASAAAPDGSAAKAQSVGATTADIHASAADAYTVQRVVKDPGGATRTRYQRTYRGLRVSGG